jgi:hypothetical protein
VDRKLTIIAVVCTLLGFLGIADTIWFYTTGTLPLLPDESYSLSWPSFILYLNFFVPGVIVGLGIRTKRPPIRVLGLLLAFVWAVFAGSVIGVGVYGMLHPAMPVPAGTGIRAIAFFALLLAFCIWEIAVLSGAASLQYFDVVPQKKLPVSIAKQINLIATVVTLLGLDGVIETIWFYATGTKGPLIDASFTLGWTSFALYLNVYVPGIIIGPGLRTQTEAFRIFGVIFTVVWGLASVFLIVIMLLELPHAPNVFIALYAATILAVAVWSLKYFFWQFNVLRGPASIKYFSEWDYVVTAGALEPITPDQTTCPARDSNSEPPG